MHRAGLATSWIRLEGKPPGAYHLKMAHCRRSRGGAGSGSWLWLTPLVGLVMACGASGWTDVSPDSIGGRGNQGGTGVATGGTFGAGAAAGNPGAGGGGGFLPGAGGATGGAGGGGAGEGAGGTGGAVEIDAEMPIDTPPGPDEDAGVPPPPPVDGGSGDLAPVGDGPAGVNLALGLVGRWKLDEGTGTMAADLSGHGNDGTIKGASWVTGGFPAAKYANPAALRFAGNDSVQLGTHNLPANNRPQTVAFWLNYTAIPGGDAQVCVALTDGKANGSRLKLGFKTQRLAALKGGGSNTLVNVASPAPGWHHFAYSFDGVTHRLYVDGLQRTTSTTAPDTGAASNARLGGNFDQTESFTGFLDEVRIYDRPLAPAEIGALFAGEE